MPDKLISVIAKELGRRGGKETLRRHGTKFFSDLSKKRWRIKSAEDTPVIPIDNDTSGC